MAYDDYELSVASSQPEELFEFEYLNPNGSVYYRVTSAGYDIVHSDETYTALRGIRSGKIQSTAEIGKNQMVISGIPRDTSYFLRHLFGTKTYETIVRIYHVQVDDYILAWSGKMSSVTRPKGAGLSVTCNPISTMAKKPISCGLYGIICSHKLFDTRCGVDRETWTREGTLDTVDGTTITSTTFGLEDDGFFTGGELTVSDEVKTIINHIGDTVTILDSFYSDDAESGYSFSATAGCQHDMDACNGTFNNHLNYGGYPFFPDADDIQTGKPFTR